MTHALINVHTEDYRPLAELTWYKNKIPYAERHGYATFSMNSHFIEGVQIGYQKLHLIRGIMESRPDIEWMWYTGTDSLITNMTIRIEDKIDKLSDVSTANTLKLAENTASLVDHMRRTEILEEELKTQKTNIKEVEDNVDFIVKFPKYLYLFGKWVAGIGAACATVYSVIKLFIKP